MSTHVRSSMQSRVLNLIDCLSSCTQVFDNVTILFSDVVGFTRICSQISPMEVVSMLNAMYTQFDQLSEKHNVYKVSIYFISIIQARCYGLFKLVL